MLPTPVYISKHLGKQEIKRSVGAGRKNDSKMVYPRISLFPGASFFLGRKGLGEHCGAFFDAAGLHLRVLLSMKVLVRCRFLALQCDFGPVDLKTSGQSGRAATWERPRPLIKDAICYIFIIKAVSFSALFTGGRVACRAEGILGRGILSLPADVSLSKTRNPYGSPDVAHIPL